MNKLYETTLAKTDRGKCSTCRKMIPKGDVKIIVSPGYRRLANIEYRYNLCSACAMESIERDKSRLDQVIKNIKNKTATYYEDADYLRDKRIWRKKMKETAKNGAV